MIAAVGGRGYVEFAARLMLRGRPVPSKRSFGMKAETCFAQEPTKIAGGRMKLLAKCDVPGTLNASERLKMGR